VIEDEGWLVTVEELLRAGMNGSLSVVLFGESLYLPIQGAAKTMTRIVQTVRLADSSTRADVSGHLLGFGNG
jgi:hypothetical protein